MAAGTFSQSSVLNSSHSVQTTTAWEPGQVFVFLTNCAQEEQKPSATEKTTITMSTFRGGVGVVAAGDKILHLVHVIFEEFGTAESSISAEQG